MKLPFFLRVAPVIAVGALIGQQGLANADQSGGSGNQGIYQVDDDGSGVVASNATGHSDKVLVLHPNKGSDHDFVVEVYDPDDPSTVLSSVEYTAGNTPPITVGPGEAARAVDPKDHNGKDLEGTSSFG